MNILQAHDERGEDLPVDTTREVDASPGPNNHIAPRQPVRICVIGLGGGGFHRQVQEIVSRLTGPVELVLVFSGPGRSGGIRSWKPSHPVRCVYTIVSPVLMGDSTIRSVAKAWSNFFRAFMVLYAEQPDIVLAVGTPQAIPFGVVCRMLRCPLWYTESWTRVRRLSRTTRWLSRCRLASRFFYMWPALSLDFPRGTCVAMEVEK